MLVDGKRESFLFSFVVWHIKHSDICTICPSLCRRLSAIEPEIRIVDGAGSLFWSHVQDNCPALAALRGYRVVPLCIVCALMESNDPNKPLYLLGTGRNNIFLVEGPKSVSMALGIASLGDRWRIECLDGAEMVEGDLLFDYRIP